MAGLCSIHKEIDPTCKLCAFTGCGWITAEKIFVGNNIEINELIQLLEKHRTEATDYKEVTVYFSSEKDGDVSINLECEK